MSIDEKRSTSTLALTVSDCLSSQLSKKSKNQPPILILIQDCREQQVNGNYQRFFSFTTYLFVYVPVNIS